MDLHTRNESHVEAAATVIDKTPQKSPSETPKTLRAPPQSAANLSPEQYAEAKRTLINAAEKKRRDEDQARMMNRISQRFSKGQ